MTCRADARVVDEDVEPAKVLARCFDHGPTVASGGDVGAQRHDSAVTQAHLSGEFIQKLRRARGSKNQRAALGCLDGQTSPDTLRSSSDQYPRTANCSPSHRCTSACSSCSLWFALIASRKEAPFSPGANTIPRWAGQESCEDGTNPSARNGYAGSTASPGVSAPNHLECTRYVNESAKRLEVSHEGNPGRADRHDHSWHRAQHGVGAGFRVRRCIGARLAGCVFAPDCNHPGRALVAVPTGSS